MSVGEQFVGKMSVGQLAFDEKAGRGFFFFAAYYNPHSAYICTILFLTA
jgi:hypothetical protein